MHKHVGGILLVWGAIVAVACTVGWAFSSDHVETNSSTYTVYYKPGTYKNTKNVISTIPKSTTLTSQYYNRYQQTATYTKKSKNYQTASLKQTLKHPKYGTVKTSSYKSNTKTEYEAPRKYSYRYSKYRGKYARSYDLKKAYMIARRNQRLNQMKKTY